MADSKALYPKFTTVWASVPEEGLQLEIACEISGQTVYFANFVADEKDEALSLELTVQGQRVRIPLDRLEELIAAAREGVHSEAWYDRNPPDGS